MDKKIYRKYSNKRVNSKKENIPFNLSFDDYKNLMRKSNISIDDIGIKKYHLARYNDTGCYEIGNCRFVYYLINLREKKISNKSRKASRKNLLKVNALRSLEERIRIGKLGGLASGGRNKLTEDEINKRIKLIDESDINLMRYGWVNKVSKLLNITHTHVKRFIDENYNKPFYRRN